MISRDRVRTQLAVLDNLIGGLMFSGDHTHMDKDADEMRGAVMEISRIIERL